MYCPFLQPPAVPSSDEEDDEVIFKKPEVPSPKGKSLKVCRVIC